MLYPDIKLFSIQDREKYSRKFRFLRSLYHQKQFLFLNMKFTSGFIIIIDFKCFQISTWEPQINFYINTIFAISSLMNLPLSPSTRIEISPFVRKGLFLPFLDCLFSLY